MAAYNSNYVQKITGVCHPNWRGIKAATYSLVPNVVEIGEIESMTKAEEAAIEILKTKPLTVILSGYPQGYDLLAQAIKKLAPQTRIFFISHAPFTWYGQRHDEASWLERMFAAYHEGYIEKIGFVKKDPAVYFKERGMNTFFLMNRPPTFEPFRHQLQANNVQIGVWGSDMWHRNLLNQALGASMVKQAHIHLNELAEYFFLDESRITRHGVLSREEYIPILRTMDVNLYISFTDCFPMTVIESMAHGIPCLISDTSAVYDWNEYLKRELVVSKIDSPAAIAEKITWLLAHYEKVQNEISSYLPVLRAEIEKSIEEFLL